MQAGFQLLSSSSPAYPAKLLKPALQVPEVKVLMVQRS